LSKKVSFVLVVTLITIIYLGTVTNETRAIIPNSTVVKTFGNHHNNDKRGK
jgi:hypothetical protein